MRTAFLFPTVLIFLVLSNPFKATAQHTVSDFLLTAFEDRNTSHFDAQRAFLKPRNYRYPILEEVELRMGNDEQTYEDLQYALRVRPGNPWRIRRNNAFFNATRKELELQKRREYKENLMMRYELALEYFHNRELAAMIEESLDIISRKANIMEENLQSELFDGKDYSEAKLDQVEAIDKLEESLVELNRIQVEIELILDTGDLNWINFSLIKVETIEELAGDIATQSNPSVELDLISQQAEVARQEGRVEKADFDIGYAQLEYFPFTNRKSNYGFSVGVTLPIFKDNKPQIAERKLDELELEGELEFEQHRDSINKIREYQHLKNLIAQHRLMLKKVDELNLKAMQNNLANSEDFDPLTILDLQEGIAKLDEVILKSRFRVLSQFVDFLYTYDALAKSPLTNYLSEDLMLIE
ncbi:MAG: hypothetical protein JJ953_06120 [Gracilimonas sp.]|uniref:hypothetical protein n=1 Tax=Gracilimonas TaxID=649462 RepID=UPI001AFEEB7F|nr:hypothetical protein [Gracilimonas sp.]MBO6585662.1 hypothetical protein [Gracilimonas sp.]MBO6616659.1 hypothetical protein [Gracilimonas sp.]